MSSRLKKFGHTGSTAGLRYLVALIIIINFPSHSLAECELQCSG